MTKWFASKVPLYVLQMENDMVLESWPFGDFTYYDDVQLSSRRMSQTSPLSATAPTSMSSLPHHDSYSATTTAAISTNVAAYDNTGLYSRSTITSSPYARSGCYNTMAPHMPTYSQADLAASSYANSGYIQSSQPVTSSYVSQPQPLSLPGYSPYSNMMNKANLKFTSNLDDMALNWSGDEWESHRRLVQFWRRQDNNDIQCSFAPVSPADRQPNSIVISCIYWAEKNDCFLTSVDCIYLLESLIEKNRIRRNLEGFRPITVSKCKPESAEFFKLIMSFPNPKPRNIEKDVKVFPWKVLSYALKKIISKYTASYSNTTGLQQPESFHNANFPHGSTLPLTPQQQSMIESSMMA
ncbi:hypothetical protein BGZ65_002464 [Modicella reniformis]|uniref:DUF7082 domain-containing protein n=1 Tax=Modicella reniformis TaxID=1440133 RepID=A0A9P6IM15_9FUNG|nr:hypothetical protein BGZ65_002464 [Modicella reniformis]